MRALYTIYRDYIGTIVYIIFRDSLKPILRILREHFENTHRIFNAYWVNSQRIGQAHSENIGKYSDNIVRASRMS